MKTLFKSSLIATLAIITTTISGFNEPSNAQNTKYFCAQLWGEWKTFMRTNRGNIPLITWDRAYGNYWTPRRRCIEVSRRFERQHDNGSLNHISTGVVNNQSVLCGVRSRGNSCRSFNVLVTLPPNTTPSQRYQYARRLLNTRSLASGNTIRLNETPLETFINGENYYDISVIEEIGQPITENLTPIEE